MEKSINDSMNINTAAMTASMDTTKKQSSGLKIGMAVCACLAIAGLGFGVYEMTQVNQAKQQISNLKVEVENEDDTTTISQADAAEAKDDQNTTANSDATATRKNPIISAPDEDTIFETYFESSYYRDLSNNTTKRLNIKLQNGKVSECRIYGGEGPDECEISAPNEKIYKIAEAGAGHVNDYNIICFIMEDGTVEYFPLFEAIETGNFNSRGKLKIDGFVTDIISQGSVRAAKGASGGGMTFYILDDGTYMLHDSSMLE